MYLRMIHIFYALLPIRNNNNNIIMVPTTTTDKPLYFSLSTAVHTTCSIYVTNYLILYYYLHRVFVAPGTTKNEKYVLLHLSLTIFHPLYLFFFFSIITGRLKFLFMFIINACRSCKLYSSIFGSINNCQ